MDFSLDTLRSWLAVHGVAVFALFAFIDTFVLTGLFVPASLVIVAAGFFCAEGLAPAGPALVWMYVAAFAGNELTYWLARWWGGWMLRWLRRHVPRVRRMLEREGPSLLLYYHFANTLRAALPVLCGSLRYPHGRYLVFNTPGLIIWVSALFGIGYLSYFAVAESATLWQRIPSILSVGVLLVALWRIWAGLKRAGREQNNCEPSGGAA
jgi:undecaprenyl-diphosphatase